MIETWSKADGSTDYRWSVWRNGHRMHMGGPHPTAESAEAEARNTCLRTLGTEPDSVLHL